MIQAEELKKEVEIDIRKKIISGIKDKVNITLKKNEGKPLSDLTFDVINILQNLK